MAAVDEAAASAPTMTWTCDVCNCTINVKGDGRAEENHINGRPHQKKLAKLGLAAPPEKRKRSSESDVVDAIGRTADASSNSKSVLNEMCQQRKWVLKYEFQRLGKDHEPEASHRLEQASVDLSLSFATDAAPANWPPVVCRHRPHHARTYPSTRLLRGHSVSYQARRRGACGGSCAAGHARTRCSGL